jgi:hypothetical protein
MTPVDPVAFVMVAVPGAVTVNPLAAVNAVPDTAVVSVGAGEPAGTVFAAVSVTGTAAPGVPLRQVRRIVTALGTRKLLTVVTTVIETSFCAVPVVVAAALKVYVWEPAVQPAVGVKL